MKGIRTRHVKEKTRPLRINTRIIGQLKEKLALPLLGPLRLGIVRCGPGWIHPKSALSSPAMHRNDPVLDQSCLRKNKLTEVRPFPGGDYQHVDVVFGRERFRRSTGRALPDGDKQPHLRRRELANPKPG